jgi:hypothetical protein
VNQAVVAAMLYQHSDCYKSQFSLLATIWLLSPDYALKRLGETVHGIDNDTIGLQTHFSIDL